MNSAPNVAAITFALAATVLLACGGRAGNEGIPVVGMRGCIPGEQIACACANSRSNVQVCQSDGTYGPCACGAPSGVTSGFGGTSNNAFDRGGATSTASGGSGATASTTRGGAANSGTGASTGSAAASSTGTATSSGNGGASPSGAGTVVLTSGADKLIEAFPADTGLLVVSANAVHLLDRAGTELIQVPSPREITAAAFDGTLLVVADKARITTYDPALTVFASGDLVEACASAVLLSNSRFVCGPANDWDRIFYTYDALSGTLRASSKKYTYNGIPMRRVPGKDDFVTVSTDSSPSDFHLYSLTGDEAQFINESPYHGDFRVTNVYAFDASPPEHLITDAGLFLHIYGNGCSTATNSFTSECFTKDGALGTLSGAQIFVGMDSDGAGHVFGLVDPSDTFAGNPCEKNCIAQRIDLESRAVTSQRIHTLSASRIVVTRHDPIAAKLLVGYIKATDSYYLPNDPYPGYQIALLDYGP
jgi:hypothetical protein